MDNNNNGNSNDLLARAAGMKQGERTMEQYDPLYNLILLLCLVVEFKPPERWILSLLKTREYKDFKNQILTMIEDYEEYRV